jgi:hypothetical protein
MPARDIISPNLLKSRYFRSGKNTPKDQSDNEGDNNLDEYEVFDVEDVLNNRKAKLKKKTSQISEKFNPYAQGKVQLKKKKKGEEDKEDSGENELDDVEYLKQKAYFEKMIQENNSSNNVNNVKPSIQKQNTIKSGSVLNNQNVPKDQREDKEIQTGEDFYNQNESYNKKEEEEKNCAMCNSASFIDSKVRLKKRENPSLLEPQEIK